MNDTVSRLASVIDLIARKVPNGLSALCGNAPEPTMTQLELAFWRPQPEEEVQVTKDAAHDRTATEAIRNVMTFSILDEIEWSRITAAVAWLSKNCLWSQNWEIYREYTALSALPRAYGTGSIAQMLAEKYNVSQATIYRIIRVMPEAVAKATIFGAHNEIK